MSIGGAVAIGIAAALAWTPWLLLFVAAGGFLVVAYNLELFGGVFHTTSGSGSRGGFPCSPAILVRPRLGRSGADRVLRHG